MNADSVFKTLTKLNREYELGATVIDMVTECYCTSYNEKDLEHLVLLAYLVGYENTPISPFMTLDKRIRYRTDVIKPKR